MPEPESFAWALAPENFMSGSYLLSTLYNKNTNRMAGIEEKARSMIYYLFNRILLVPDTLASLLVSFTK